MSSARALVNFSLPCRSFHTSSTMDPALARLCRRRSPFSDMAYPLMTHSHTLLLSAGEPDFVRQYSSSRGAIHWSERTTLHLPTRIGKYELLQYLGGGMSEVYRARDTNLGRSVAFKILTEAALADATAKSRMQEEARVAGGLAHESVIAFYDYGEEAGRPFLVMEYFVGETLREALRGGRAGDLRKRLLIARQLANALAYVHSKGIVHRDVKPDNVRINASGDVK